jgi:hypothetical protein
MSFVLLPQELLLQIFFMVEAQDICMLGQVHALLHDLSAVPLPIKLRHIPDMQDHIRHDKREEHMGSTCHSVSRNHADDNCICISC